MGCAGLCKALLIIINILFMIVSLVFVAAGVILVFVVDIILEDAFKSAKEEAASAGYTISGEASDLKDVPLLYEIGIALLIFGILLFLLSILAWCGSCCTSCCRPVLLVFAVILGLLIVAEVTVFSLFMQKDSPLHKTLKEEVQDKITTDYDEVNGNTFSSAIILINREGDCCGMEGVADFGTKQHRSCDAANEQKGCYDEMQDLLQDNKLYAALGASGLFLLQVIEVICAIIIFKDSGAKITPF